MRRTWRRVALLALLVQVAVLYWPRPPDVGAAVPGLDLVVHLLVFAAVALAARRAGLPVVPVTLALAAHAVLSEVAQAYLVPERTGDWRDTVADLVGTAVGTLAARPGPWDRAAGRSRAAS